jgi:hypothetical protein
LTETAVAQIDGDVTHSALGPRWKDAVAWADTVIGARPPGRPPGELTRAELAELTLTVAVAQGFSKAAIAWGPAPELPTMVIPTPGS